jgi:arabinose-5-phosphate isomerase
LLQRSTTGLGEPFTRAVETLGSISGRVIVTGVGKSGHIGAKIAATMASTGTPAHFVHPAEANHGDLGMITRTMPSSCCPGRARVPS